MYWRDSMAAMAACLISSSTGGRDRGICVTFTLLTRAQDVDREAAALAQRREALGLVVHAHQHQRRLERHRGEGAAGEAGRMLVGIGGGHDRHAGAEVTENFTKVVGTDHRPYVA